MSDRVDTPPALSAVISFSDARRLNAYSTATRTAIGSVIASVNGIESRKNSVIDLPGKPAAHQIPEPSCDVLEQQERRERREGEHERSNVLLEDVSIDYFHESVWTVVRPRNFKHSTGLYGRARPVYSTRHPLDSRLDLGKPVARDAGGCAGRSAQPVRRLLPHL